MRQNLEKNMWKPEENQELSNVEIQIWNISPIRGH